MKGFTKSGQPIMGRKYTAYQGDEVFPFTLVGKLFGRKGNADLIGIVCEEPSGARGSLPWPLEAGDDAPTIRLRAGWPEELGIE